MNKNRVIVAMSGGVDSSVTLKLLIDEGYETIGVTMKLWEYKDVGGNVVNESNCCSIEAINNAKIVCRDMGIPHYTLDFQDTFRCTVVDDFIDEYFSGRTPNPCVRCNIYLKWDALIHQADKLGAYWIATGHYAIIDRANPENPILKRGIDTNKDQSYVLWGISKNTLKRTLFPLGKFNKSDVRKIARDSGIITAETPESQEICFVPDDNYRRFLRFYAPDKIENNKSGNFISCEGEIIGKHDGIWQFTVGQRRRLGVTGPEPLYVQDINPGNNNITLAPRSKMLFDGCTVEQINWFQNPVNLKDMDMTIHIRYNHSGVKCKIAKLRDSSISVDFESPQFAVAPGQSAVFYSGNTVLGGGIIMEGRLHE